MLETVMKVPVFSLADQNREMHTGDQVKAADNLQSMPEALQ